MPEGSPDPQDSLDIEICLADASTDLLFALGSLRFLTILPFCPDVARDSEERVACALEGIAKAREFLRAER
jgi:hypothetical protein